MWQSTHRHQQVCFWPDISIQPSSQERKTLGWKDEGRNVRPKANLLVSVSALSEYSPSVMPFKSKLSKGVLSLCPMQQCVKFDYVSQRIRDLPASILRAWPRFFVDSFAKTLMWTLLDLIAESVHNYYERVPPGFHDLNDHTFKAKNFPPNPTLFGVCSTMGKMVDLVHLFKVLWTHSSSDSDQNVRPGDG